MTRAEDAAVWATGVRPHDLHTFTVEELRHMLCHQCSPYPTEWLESALRCREAPAPPPPAAPDSPGTSRGEP